MTVRQLLNSIDSRELSEWYAFLNLDELRVIIDRKYATDEERSGKILSFFRGKKT